ncbi:hypothetical protein AMTRI_Chr03g144380 [Amborella trichopoda]
MAVYSPLCSRAILHSPSSSNPQVLPLNSRIRQKLSPLNLPLQNLNPKSLQFLKLNPRFLRFRINCAANQDLSVPENQAVGKEVSVAGKFHEKPAYKQWDSLTATFAGAANVPFLLLQLPQIILNAQNLLAGNKTALFAVPWIGMLTGLLGNLSLLSYFAKKKETEAVVVQTLGVISTYIVLVQLAMAEAMPLLQFSVTSIVVASGLILNFMNFFNLLNSRIWTLWEDFMTVGGLSVLPQVMWATFIPFLPNTAVPGAMAFTVALFVVFMARTGKLTKKATKFVGSISGWTATLLFMWMPIAQMWTNFLNPDNIRGLSAFTMLLAMIGNGLMIPRALFIRDFMWFTGSFWASLLHGWGNLICMYWCNTISWTFFLAATIALVSWLGMALWRDTKAYGYNSPFTSLKKLVSGS